MQSEEDIEKERKENEREEKRRKEYEKTVMIICESISCYRDNMEKETQRLSSKNEMIRFQIILNQIISASKIITAGFAPVKEIIRNQLKNDDFGDKLEKLDEDLKFILDGTSNQLIAIDKFFENTFTLMIEHPDTKLGMLIMETNKMKFEEDAEKL